MFSRISATWRKCAGQATVEAAFVLPIVCILVLLLVQPAIVLYDRMVMAQAAGEACRVLMTLNGSDTRKCEDFARRRLASIPQQDNFHVHSGGCSWGIVTCGDESCETVSVEIQGKLKPLPLIGAVSQLVGACDVNGYWTIREYVEMSVQPGWVNESSSGVLPGEWPGAWFS